MNTTSEGNRGGKRPQPGGRVFCREGDERRTSLPPYRVLSLSNIFMLIFYLIWVPHILL